jgi:hypothetical protein
MAVTLEFGKCEQCGDNNSKTTAVCRSCKAPLPWAQKTAKTVSKPTNSANHNLAQNSSDPGFAGLSKGFYMQILGGVIFAAGAVFWLGNKSGFFPTFPGLGYLGLTIGGCLWGAGAGMGE